MLFLYPNPQLVDYDLMLIIIIINHSYIALIEFCTFLGMLTFYSALQGIEVMLCDILFMIELLYLWKCQFKVVSL